MKPLPVNSERAADLKRIAALGPAKIEAIAIALTGQPVTVGADGLLEVFREHIDDDDARLLLSHIVSLTLLMDEVGVGSAEVVEALRVGLAKHGVDEQEQKNFEAVCLALATLMDSETLYVSAKATQLFAADSLHLHEIRIYSDCRPVYDRARAQVYATLVFNTISIVGSNSREEESNLSVTLRQRDLIRLKQECEKALEKTRILEAALRASKMGEIIVYGKEPI